MSSQDKNGPQDGTEDAAAEDHAQNTAAELPENGLDGPENPQDAPESAEKQGNDGIEDAEIVGDAASAPDDDRDDALTETGADTGDSPFGADDREPDMAMDDTGETGIDAVVTNAADTDAADTDAASDDRAGLAGAAATAALAGTAAAAASMGAAGADADPVRPAAATTEAPAKAAPQKSGGGFVPALLGGVVAAGIGFGAAVYLGGDLLGGDDTLEQGLAAQDSKLTALDTRLGELTTAMATPPDTGMDDQISALGDRLAEQLGGVAARIETLAATVDTVQGGLSGLESQLGALDSRLADVNDRLSAVEKRPLTESSEAAQAAFSAYERDLEELRSALDQQNDANETLAAQMEERAAAAQAEVEAAGTRAAELQAQAEEQARVAAEQADARARAAAVREAMASLDAALEKGAPFAAPLGVLAEGAEMPEALTDAAAGGIASLPDLRAEFPPLARDALDASIRETVDDDVADRAYAFLRAQTGLRSLEPRDGDDPDAVLSRAEAALRSGDLATSLSELGQLPSAGQAVMSDWMARAEQRRAVTEAAATLADTLLAN